MAKRNDDMTFRALDQGFGFTKFSTSNIMDADLDVSMIPSFAQISTGTVDHSDLEKADVFTVQDGESIFHVGAGSLDMATAGARRIVSEMYFGSPQYRALARAAIAKMNVPENGVIDHLVAGLPISYMKQEHVIASSQEFLQSTHVVPDLRNVGKTREIKVKRVSILPQIVGSLYGLTAEKRILKEVAEKKRTCVTFDVGYGTLLWLTTNGFKLQHNKSGGIDGGVNKLLEHILGNKREGRISDIAMYEKLDTAFYTGQEIVMIDAAPHSTIELRKLLDGLLETYLSTALASMSDRGSVDYYFLTGGGAHYYREAIKKLIAPAVLMETEHDSQFDNVRGFQIYAQQGY